MLNLVQKNAKDYIALRDMGRVRASIDEITARLEALQLGLCDFTSVKAAAEEFRAAETELHVLLGDAGVATLPYSLTADGYDAQCCVGDPCPVRGLAG